MKIKPQVLAARAVALCAVAATSFAAASCWAAAPPAPPAQLPWAGAKEHRGNWKLVWSDEFDKYGPPDPRNWNFESGFVRNEEDQWYQPSNAWCSNGLLTIEARREDRPNPNYEAGSAGWKKQRQFAHYTSSSLTSGSLHAWRYGRFEMRARIDTRAGMWPAFWTVGTQGEWPSGGEIDIMEFYRGNLLANLAWGTGTRWAAKWHSTRTPLEKLGDPMWSTRFHVWRMDWDQDFIRLFVDGRLLNETNLKDTVNGDAQQLNPFHQPQSIILNLAIGGQNGGDPAPTALPAKFEVDYIRVYQNQPSDAAN